MIVSATSNAYIIRQPRRLVDMALYTECHECGEQMPTGDEFWLDNFPYCEYCYDELMGEREYEDD